MTTTKKRKPHRITIETIYPHLVWDEAAGVFGCLECMGAIEIDVDGLYQQEKAGAIKSAGAIIHGRCEEFVKRHAMCAEQVTVAV